MSAIEWTEAYNTGIDQVDQDHRKLVSLINALDKVLDQQTDLGNIGGIIDDLAEYTEYHFQREEELMREHSYAELAEHALVHESFCQRIGEMIGECMVGSAHENARVLRAYLGDWLVHHILDEDMRYVAALQA